MMASCSLTCSSFFVVVVGFLFLKSAWSCCEGWLLTTPLFLPHSWSVESRRWRPCAPCTRRSFRLSSSYTPKQSTCSFLRSTRSFSILMPPASCPSDKRTALFRFWFFFFNKGTKGTMGKLPAGRAVAAEEAELTGSPRRHCGVGVQQPEAATQGQNFRNVQHSEHSPSFTDSVKRMYIRAC